MEKKKIKNETIYEAKERIILFLLPRESAVIPEGISRTFIIISLKEINNPISKKFNPVSRKNRTIKGSKNLRFFRTP